MKKTAVGVRGIRLDKDDEVEAAYLLAPGAEVTAQSGQRTVALNRLKLAKRDGKGVKHR